MLIVHLYSGGRTGTYQRGLLPKYTIHGSYGNVSPLQKYMAILGIYVKWPKGGIHIQTATVGLHLMGSKVSTTTKSLRLYWSE